MQKNHSFLIDIFYEIRKCNKESVLLLVGDGELHPQIERKVRALNLQDCVVFTGLRSDVNELYQAMDVFVLPSLYEGLGMVAVEAQAAGLPCYISSEVPSEAILVPKQCKTLPLDVSPEIWAKTIIKDFDIYHRESDMQAINEQGYDIQEEARALEEYYQVMGH
jgi:glycosyltransferase involved in cell wall biosynthesis